MFIKAPVPEPVEGKYLSKHRSLSVAEGLFKIGVPFRGAGVIGAMFATVSTTIATVCQVFFGHDTVTFRRQIIIYPFYQFITIFNILFHSAIF